MGALGKTARYYAENPEARAKKNAYQKKYNKRKGESESRVRHAKARRDLGLKVGDNIDASKCKDGSFTKEGKKQNRARQGSNGKSTKI